MKGTGGAIACDPAMRKRGRLLRRLELKHGRGGMGYLVPSFDIHALLQAIELSALHKATWFEQDLCTTLSTSCKSSAIITKQTIATLNSLSSCRPHIAALRSNSSTSDCCVLRTTSPSGSGFMINTLNTTVLISRHALTIPERWSSIFCTPDGGCRLSCRVGLST